MSTCPSRRGEHSSCGLPSVPPGRQRMQWGRLRVTPAKARSAGTPGGRWAWPGEPGMGAAAAQPVTPTRAGCWRLFATVTASGCCRSVEPKETAARASTEQDGGSRVSVSVCGAGRGAGRGAPSWSFPAGGGRQGLGTLQAGRMEGGDRCLQGGFSPTCAPPPRGSFPALGIDPRRTCGACWEPRLLRGCQGREHLPLLCPEHPGLL